MNNWKAYLAEAVGTYLLVYVGCGAIIVNAMTNRSLGNIGITIAFAAIVVVVISAIGHISHSHINPAVTIALALTRKFPLHDVPAYVAAQICGATAAAFTLAAISPRYIALTVTEPSGSVVQAFLVECIGTAILLYVIAAMYFDQRAIVKTGAFVVGVAVLGIDLTAGPISGGSLNPARSLGPALAAHNFANLLIYMTAPILGGILGVLAYDLVGQTAVTPVASGKEPIVQPAPKSAAPDGRAQQAGGMQAESTAHTQTARVAVTDNNHVSTNSNSNDANYHRTPAPSNEPHKVSFSGSVVSIDKAGSFVTVNLLSRNDDIRTDHNLFNIAIYSGTAIVQGNVYMPLQNLPIGSFISGIALAQDGRMLALKLAVSQQAAANIEHANVAG